MIFVLVLISLFALAGPVATGRARAEAPYAVSLGPVRESLRGESVDLDDPWDCARLFARFGDFPAAYDVLCSRPADESDDAALDLLAARLLTRIGSYERADSVLALRANVWDARERYLHYLWRAWLNTACGRYDEALGFVARMPECPDSLFDAYKDFVACDALLGKGDVPVAIELAEKRLSRETPSALTVELETRLLDGYLKEGRTGDALGFLEELRGKVSGHAGRAELLAREVEVRFLHGDARGAIDAAVGLVKNDNASGTIGVVDTVLARTPADSLNDEALLLFAEVLVRRSRNSDADRLISILSARALDEPQKEQRRSLKSELLYKQKRYNAAEREVRRPFAEGRLERKAKLLRARIYRAVGERLRAAEAYEVFAKAFPYDAKAAEALYVAWDIQREAGRPAKAAEVLTTIVKTYPSNKYARLATLSIVQGHVERREYTLGARVLERALERHNREDEAFLYYLADVYGRMGNAEKKAKLMEELAALDRVSFYLDPEIPSPLYSPDLFESKNGDSTGSRVLLEFLEAAFKEREAAYRRVRTLVRDQGGEPGAVERLGCLTRGRVFAEMGLRDWAEAEFREAELEMDRPPGMNLALASFYDEIAMPRRSIRAIQRVYYSLGKRERRQAESDFGLLTCPVPFPSLVLASCRREGIAPHLVYAMIREESRFDDKAVSAAGAMGLMQIMPATGEQLAGELGFEEDAGRRLLSPDVNVSLGVFYAARLLERWNGDPLKMLAAYNAGSGNAARWFNNRSDRKPRIEQVDGITFWETREYVKRIVESARLYFAFYFSPPIAAAGEPAPMVTDP